MTKYCLYMSNKKNKNLSDRGKIELIRLAYKVYIRKIRKIEKERDEKIAEIINGVEKKKIEAIKKSLKK